MSVREINFDGLIGPSHNYAGLSHGNLASANNAGAASYPRAAALQGIEKMRTNLRLGLTQGIFVPQWRPDGRWLNALGTNISEAEPHIRAAAMSASSMWAANAATVSPGPDTADRRTHLTVANLVTMPHRSHEWSPFPTSPHSRCIRRSPRLLATRAPPTICGYVTGIRIKASKYSSMANWVAPILRASMSKPARR